MLEMAVVFLVIINIYIQQLLVEHNITFYTKLSIGKAAYNISFLKNRYTTFKR